MFRIPESIRVVTIIGTAKNVGKTTALNHFLKQEKEGLFITSIGLDGEEKDQVFGTDKPTVHLKEGDLFATSMNFARSSDITYAIKESTGIGTSTGDVLVFEAKSAGNAIIAGPSSGSDMKKLVEMATDYKMRVFIDGAYGRRAFAPAGSGAGVILSTGLNYSEDINKLVSDTAHLVRILTLRKYEGQEEALRIHGALTDKMALEIISARKAKVIIADTSFSVLITEKVLKRMKAAGISLHVNEELNLLGIAINPTSVTGHLVDSETLAMDIHKKTGVPVIDPGV